MPPEELRVLLALCGLLTAAAGVGLLSMACSFAVRSAARRSRVRARERLA